MRIVTIVTIVRDRRGPEPAIWPPGLAGEFDRRKDAFVGDRRPEQDRGTFSRNRGEG